MFKGLEDGPLVVTLITKHVYLNLNSSYQQNKTNKKTKKTNTEMITKEDTPPNKTLIFEYSSNTKPNLHINMTQCKS